MFRLTPEKSLAEISPPAVRLPVTVKAPPTLMSEAFKNSTVEIPETFKFPVMFASPMEISPPPPVDTIPDKLEPSPWYEIAVTTPAFTISLESLIITPPLESKYAI